MYPINDEQFEETTIAKAEKSGDGWSIQRADGWSFFVPATSPVEPTVGMSARFYGRGISSTVRGLFLDSKEVFYRTEEQDNEYRDIQMYGADATEWLKRWDDGQPVWSISLGGLGPGYEQAIQITVAEVLRHLLERQYDATSWTDSEKWQLDREEIEAAGFANPKIDALGLSGAQWGAGLHMAVQLYRRGPRDIMTDEQVKDRHIQVQRNFPQG